MFEISSHKVSSILSIHKLKFGLFFAKSWWSVLDDAVTEKADSRGFRSTMGYNVTPHYQLLGSLHVIEIFKNLLRKIEVKILLIMIPQICNIGSPSGGDQENCYLTTW